MNATQLIEAVRSAVAGGRAPDPAVRLALAVERDPTLLRRVGAALRSLDPEASGLRAVRLSVLGTGTLGALPDLLRATLVSSGLAPRIQVGEYGRFEMELAVGAFQEERPDAVLCMLSQEFFLPAVPQGMPVKEVVAHIETRLDELCGLLAGAAERTSATLILNTVPLSRSVRDSFIAVRDRALLAQAWHRLNADLLGLAATEPQLAVADLAGLLALEAATARDRRLHSYADLPYTDAALLLLAQETRRVLQAQCGLSRKVLALDADNTLWGGVLGEDGAHGVKLGGLYPGKAYKELQQTACGLREQGVVLVLASKNDASLVEEMLCGHPDAVLRPDTFSVLAANWDPKAGNLSRAADSLGLGIDSFVFMDDSPYEREHVASELPQVAVVPADGDPAHLIERLLQQGWFDVPELTATDHQRADLYRSRALRKDYSGAFSSSEDYLRALGITLTPALATPFTTARIAQLAARTNQFNLTGVRFDEIATGEMLDSADHLVASFSVSDRFGDEGIVGAAWMACEAHEWRVLNLVLSCRVLGRGVELAITDWLFDRAAEAGAARVVASFVLSAKNSVAADTWERAGMTPLSEEEDGTRTFSVELAGRPPVAPAWIALPSTDDQENSL
ncbi:HAD-IIIC family phosphatase [Nonomuraea soli]|uniref:FkbH-like protein n=1 Tax=Nonomuraea soli TaxID=1032476 RepID=A0A7W0CFK9_9ACTN|nr:HAD-IIIC family phosphatase [Nonomuraea soli]MBA2890250.1 FkbH-like protein [Nonomuraea soli]